MDLYLNYSLRKSHFPLNLTYSWTYGRTDIINYRVASLLKNYHLVENTLKLKKNCAYQIIFYCLEMSNSILCSKLYHPLAKIANFLILVLYPYIYHPFVVPIIKLIDRGNIIKYSYINSLSIDISSIYCTYHKIDG